MNSSNADFDVEELHGVKLDFDFLDTDNAYINAVIVGNPTDTKIGFAMCLVRKVACLIVRAMNLDNPQDDWIAHESELNWWSKDGVELDDDEYGRKNIHTIQCQIYR